MKIMVSACLADVNCKYNGGNNNSEKLIRFLEGNEVIKVCPEVMGGLPIPRAPGEIVDGTVRNEDGTSVDYEYRHGARLAFELAVKEKPDLIVLQSRSPSCGVKEIYDGTFSHVKIKGQGVFAQMLADAGFNVIDIEDFQGKEAD